MRVDAHSAEIIATQQMVETPDILKIMFRGTRADLGLVERIRARGFPTVESFWREAIGISDRGRMAGVGRGYQTIKPSSRIRKIGDGQPGAPAEYLHGLPDVTIGCLDDLLIDTARLEPFRHARVHDPRDSRLFEAPIAIVHKSPPAERGRIRVGVTEQPVAYNENFYGYCPGTFDRADILVRYLALVFGSKFALWLALLTSGEFGFERDVIEKSALDRIPLPDFRQLTPECCEEIVRLFDAVRASEDAWVEVDRWVTNLYGLGPTDLTIISDTLAYNLPFAETKLAAQAPPEPNVAQNFCSLLQDELAPWAERFNTPLRVHMVSARSTSPWMGLLLDTTTDTSDLRVPQDWEGLLALADATAATEVIVENNSGSLLIGRLAQSRYWSETQAHLLAQHIIWSRINFLKRPDRG
jgi:hypothetical protein